MPNQWGPRQFTLAVLLVGRIPVLTNYATADTPTWVSTDSWMIWALWTLALVAGIATQTPIVRRRSSRVAPTDRQRRRYLLTTAAVDRLPVDAGISIDRLDYGEGPQRVSIDNIGAEPVFLPYLFTMSGTKHRGATAAVYIVSDTVYPGRIVCRWSRRFTLPVQLGPGGIVPFLDDAARRGDRVVVARETGELGHLVVVEFRSGAPVARSNYVDLLRRGILRPDDIWISRVTGKPILSNEALSVARVAFQSKQPNGNSSDVFVCDVDGSRMINLTRKSFDSYDGFIRDGEEIVKWSGRSLTFASQQAPNGERTVSDPA